MATVTPAEAVARLEAGHAQITQLAAGLTEEEVARPATIGGGDWSALDLIGHLATWEEVALRSLDEFRRGETPWVERPEGPFSAPATGRIDAFNARTVEEKRRRSPDQVRTGAERTHRRLIEALGSVSEDEWKARAFYPTPKNRRRHLHSLLGSVLGGPEGPFLHAGAHVPDLEAYVRSVRPLRRSARPAAPGSEGSA